MEDADPDTRLARELHRELNGLTRQRRGRPQPIGPDRQKGQVAAHGPHGKPKQKRSHSSSHDKQHSKRRRSSDGEEAHAPSSRPHIKKEHPAASDSSNSTSRPGRHHKEGARQAGDAPHSKAATASPQAKPKQRSSKQRQQGSDNSGHSQRLLPDYQPPQPNHMLPPPGHDELALHAALTPDAAAAATAAQQVKQKTAAATDNHHLSDADSEDLVKVFYAGVPWGTALPRSQLSSRLRLARALNEAFVGDILSVGRGAALVVVFVDGSGRAVEVAPPIDGGSKARDGEGEQWRSLSAKAVRLYVRGLADEAPLVLGTIAT